MSLGSLELPQPIHSVYIRTRWLSVPKHSVLFMLLALTLIRGILYAVVNPPFESPDERAHFEYVAYVATNGASGPRGAEGHQPLPYYALMAPAYLITSGHAPWEQLLAIRLFSIPLLLGTVAFTWLAARRVSPNSLFVPVMATAIVSLHPEITVIGASANNDVAANLAGSVLTYLTVVIVGGGSSRWTLIATAVALCAALATKGQILPIVAVTAIVLLIHSVHQAIAGRSRWLLLYPMLVAIGALAFTKSTAGEVFVSKGLATLSVLPRLWGGSTGIDPMLLTYQFTGFWAIFINDSLRPPMPAYLAPLLIFAVALVGYLIDLVCTARNGRTPDKRSVLRRGIFAAMILLQGLMLLFYYLRWSEDPSYTMAISHLQGRYLLTVLSPIALLTAEGWSLLIRWTGWRVCALLIIVALVAFDMSSLVALSQYHYWQPRG